MLSSKYGNLPDIDTESPEVFESVNAVEEELEVDVESEDVDGNRLDAPEDAIEQGPGLSVSGATQIFREKEQQVRKLKGSSVSLGRRRGEALFSSETRAQRLNRLSLELYELKQEIEEDEKTKQSKTMDSIKAQLSNLDAVVAALSEAQLSDPESMKDIIERLARTNFESTAGYSNTLLKSLLQPSTSASSSKNSNLESRLEALEKLVGASVDQAYIQLPSGDILSSLYKMEHQLELISDSSQQDRLVSRFKELNALMAKNPAAFAADDKINTLYNTLDLPTLKSVPLILKRLVALKDIHSSAASMVETLHRLESRVNADGQSAKEAQEALKTVKETMKTNSERIHANVAALTERMDALNARISSLSK